MANPSIEEAATSLGIPESVLRLYLAASSKKDPYSVSISEAQVEDVRSEIAERQKGMRLDDLAKAALSIEWLAKSAETNAHDIQFAAESFTGLNDTISALQSESSNAEKQIEIEDRLNKIDQQISKLSQGDGAKALSMVAQVQEMTERQGKDIDHLRAEIRSLGQALDSMKSKLDQAAESTDRLVRSLREALQVESAPVVKEPAVEVKPSSKTTPPREEISPKEAKTTTTESEPNELNDETADKKAFENAIPDKAAKYGTKREIEFNFLYERMGYQRPDQYPHGYSGEIRGPSDEEIKQFLATYELGCSVEEVDMLIVHRGEYQMVQYQRVEAGGGFKNWIPSKRR